MKIQSNDSGNVAVEFIATAVALLIPISYLAIAALQVATSYIDVQNAARAGARTFATSASESSGKFRSTKAIQATLSTPEQVQVKFECSADPCLVAEQIVTVRVTKLVTVELPAFFGNQTIQISGVQSEVVQDAH